MFYPSLFISACKSRSTRAEALTLAFKNCAVSGRRVIVTFTAFSASGTLLRPALFFSIVRMVAHPFGWAFDCELIFILRRR